MAEILLQPNYFSKVIRIALDAKETDSTKLARLTTSRQFNTADTDAWLSFELAGLIETTGEYDLTLINTSEAPSSVVHHASIPFKGNVVHYKLDASGDLAKNEIRHAGRWVGQIVLRLSNGYTTSREFDFTITGHLMDTAEARLILVEDYNALIATITASKDELTQYNVDYAALIADVTAAKEVMDQAEIDRQATFDALVDSEMIAQNVETKLTEKETTYAPRLLAAEQQLADKADELALLSLSNQLAQTVEDVDLAHSKIKRNNENTFGTFENAAVESIIANDASARPEVLGIRLEDDHMLAIYTNRDSVASYRSNRTRKPSYNIDNVAYTVNSVTVPQGIDLSKIKNGMIIDTKHNPKFSGFIVGVEGQKILINNWYEVGNTSKGQVPSGTTGILVDPMTTPWVDNANLYLDAEDDSLDGVVFEAGIINEKADNIGKGVNVVSLGTKSPEVGFKTTGGNSPFIQGFNAGNSRTAFINSNKNTNDFLLYNEKTGYRIKNSGLQNKFLLEIAYASRNRTFDPRNAPIFLIDTPGIVKILSPSNMEGAMVYVLNILPSEILMEWPYWNPTQPGSITIPARRMKTLVSDGGTWYHF